MGLQKTHWIPLLCQEKHNCSDANDNTLQLTTLGPPSTSSVTEVRQPPSADANGLPVGGLERGERHGLKPMLRTPSTSAVTAWHANTRQLTLTALGFRQCVVEFLFHGRDRRRMSGAILPAETLRRREILSVFRFLCVSASLREPHPPKGDFLWDHRAPTRGLLTANTRQLTRTACLGRLNAVDDTG
jgi:hypothetical protein